MSKHLLPVLVHEFEVLSAQSQAAWIVDTTCGVWSVLLGLPALGLLLSASSWVSALQPRDAAPALLVRDSHLCLIAYTCCSKMSMH